MLRISRYQAAVRQESRVVALLFHGASFLLSLGAFSGFRSSSITSSATILPAPSSYSHHTWQIRSFWWYLFWMVIGGVLFVTVIGIPLAWLIWTAAWVWKAYRLLKGMLDLNDNKPMPV